MGKLIIGGVNGALGRAVTDAVLAERPGDVIAATTNPEAAQDLAPRGAEVRHADYTDPSTLADAFDGGEALLLISMPVVGAERRARHGAAIDAARAAGVERIVYTSIVGAGGDKNQSLVAGDHKWTEARIADSGLGWSFSRNSQYAEAMVDYALPPALAQGVWASNQGDGVIAYVSREDCALAAAALLMGKGEPDTAYTITGAEHWSIEDAARLATEVTGLPLPVEHLTDEENYAKFDAIGVPRGTEEGFEGSPIPYCSDDMVSFGAAIRTGGMADLTDDFTTLTGREPVSFRTLVEHAAATGRLPMA